MDLALESRYTTFLHHCILRVDVEVRHRWKTKRETKLFTCEARSNNWKMSATSHDLETP